MIAVSAAQRRWFRFRRNGLDEPFESPEATAGQLLGVQAQMPVAADVTFWNRTADANRADLAARRLEARTLVRMWGQRKTLHIYRSDDWPLLNAALPAEKPHPHISRAGLGDELAEVTATTRKRLERGDVLTARDVQSPALSAQGFPWGFHRVVLRSLTRQGLVCMGPDVGAETSYVHRLHWLPDLRWNPPAAARAASEVCRRYLAAFGPAEPRDLAFWLGCSIAQARAWLAGLDVESVDIDGIEHFCSSPDLDTLLEQPPPPSRWPVRLLYRFDPLLLATRDKTWLVDAEHYKQFWRPAGHVEPVLLIGGRAAASWRYERKGSSMVFTVSVLPGRTLARTTRAAIKREAAKLARFLEHDSAAVNYR